MSYSTNMLIPGLAVAAPALYLLVGLTPAAFANRRPRTMVRLTLAGAVIALACAVLAVTAHLFNSTHSWVLHSFKLPNNLGVFSVNIYFNAVTALMLLLVSFVGVIVTNYAKNYMEGDVDRGRFHKWLALTLFAILTLILSGNLLFFVLAWIATSLCLHKLLVFYGERRAAVLSAHKKFIASRIGDLSLVIAVALIGTTLNTLDFDLMAQKMAAMQGELPTALKAAAMLIVAAAGLKSAQFPFHGWLIQVMEAPTPVSALLHAGIVNAGAFLVLRMTPVVSHYEPALFALSLVGLVTLALASLIMLTQTSIKVSLAWSTTAQMGFMLLECGLGLYSLAMLHLVTHSLYKAHAFLASGSGVDAFRGPQLPKTGKDFRFGRLLLAMMAAVLIVGGVGSVFGLNLHEQPALLAAAFVVAMASTQLLFHTANEAGENNLWLPGLARIALVSVAYFSLETLFTAVIRDSVAPVANSGSPLQYALTGLVIITFAALLTMQQILKYYPALLGKGIYVHLHNGLYIDVFITRVIERLWPSPTPLIFSEPAPFAPIPTHGDPS